MAGFVINGIVDEWIGGNDCAVGKVKVRDAVRAFVAGGDDEELCIRL